MNAKKLLALLLAVVMVVSVFAGCGAADTTATTGAAQGDNQGTAAKNENKVIVGSTTDLSGDFRWPGFTGSSAS